MPKFTELSLWNWFLSRIWAKLALVMILVVLVPLSGLGVVLTLAAERAVRESVQRDHQEIAKRAAHEVSLFVERPLELLEATGAMIAVDQTDRWRQETVLVELSITFPIFEEVISLDRVGKVLASSNPGVEPHFAEKDEALASALRKEVYTSEVYLSKDNFPFMDAAVPYFFRGAVAGALLARVNLRGMWHIIDGIRVGETGRAYLVSKKGMLIAHPDKRRILENAGMSGKPAVVAVLAKQTGTIERDRGKEGKWLVSFAPILGELEWGLVIEQTTREAYSLVDTIRWTTALTGVLAVLVAIGASAFAARQVARPVRALDTWSRKISIGDFDYLATHRTRDELGRLFIAFKRMRDRLREAREQEYLAMLGTASSALAHKIKNSVVSLKTLADLFPLRRDDRDFMHQFEAEFPDSVGRLEQILRQLSKVASEYTLVPMPVNLHELFERIERKYHEVCQKHNVIFRVVSHDSVPPVEGDPERLFDAFENLAMNAIEAMPGGGQLAFEVSPGRGRILHPRFAGEDNVDFVEIVAKDSGAGIPKERLDEIFRPFVTTKRGGMGIGLTVVKKIVQEHGGSIAVESEPGKGTTFTILLPTKR